MCNIIGHIIVHWHLTLRPADCCNEGQGLINSNIFYLAPAVENMPISMRQSLSMGDHWALIASTHGGNTLVWHASVLFNTSTVRGHSCSYTGDILTVEPSLMAFNVAAWVWPVYRVRMVLSRLCSLYKKSLAMIYCLTGDASHNSRGNTDPSFFNTGHVNHCITFAVEYIGKRQRRGLVPKDQQ